MTGIIITTIICVTLIVLSLIGSRKKVRREAYVEKETARGDSPLSLYRYEGL
jgi:hypothetical protein